MQLRNAPRQDLCGGGGAREGNTRYSTPEFWLESARVNAARGPILRLRSRYLLRQQLLPRRICSIGYRGTVLVCEQRKFCNAIDLGLQTCILTYLAEI